jgi:hypothetical protein
MRPAKELDHDEMGTRCDLVRRARVELLRELIFKIDAGWHSVDYVTLKEMLEEAKTK